MEEKRKVVFSGIQPTGVLTLGNYVGAIRNWLKMQEDHDCIFCVVDLHAMTVRQEPTAFRNQARELLAMYLAVGLSPEKSTVFIQSHVSAHAEMAWVLNCYTGVGELSRMTQFKDKSAKNEDNINAGLFTYPVLMAADILLYQTDMVPVGDDQKQHVELTRDVAQRFNSIYGDVFKVPQVYIPPVGARIKSLAEPDKKMSKSDEPHSYIALQDPPEVIRKKMRRAVTDSQTTVSFDVENKPGVSNLLSIFSAMTDTPIDKLVAEYGDTGYGRFKDAVADAVIAKLQPVQEEFKRYLADKDYLSGVMHQGAQRAQSMAVKTLGKVYRKVGLLEKVR